MSETEPEVTETEEYDNPGIAGQIQYPEPDVDAERAAAFAGGKEETLYDEDDPRNEGWTNPADRSSEVVEADEADSEDDGE